jgi:TP901 family phage tail tape measure protein
VALNSRLTQNIDLQADGSALVQALGVIEKSLNGIVGKAGTLGKTLEGGAKAGSAGWNAQLKQLNILMGQAQNLQKILDGMASQKATKLLGGLDEQALGKKGAAASRLAQDLDKTASAADVLEKRLGGLNKRFAELTLAGRTVGQRDLAKQFNTQNALKDVQALERQFQKLNGQTASGSGTTQQRDNMARLRTEITAANAELAKMAGNYRRTEFTQQVNGLRNLTEEYRRAAAEARKFELAQPGRAQTAQRTAVGILNQSDAQRMADMKRASSGFQFPSGISQTVSQNAAEKQLASSLDKRLRLLDMIQKAQDRGAPTRTVERLNDAYKNLGSQLGENFKRLTQVNAEIDKAGKSSFLGQFQSGLNRVGIIAGASFAVAGVYTFINAIKQATQFVVDYESALKQLQAISGSTDTQMGRLASSIGEVGRNSTYSLLEITKAATVIAQAGYSAAETGEVLKSAVTLSTASGSSPTESVEVLTSALGAFQLQAGEAARVTDTLVTGLNKSKLSMTQMGQAIQYAGATANESGVKLEELTAIAASMANAGIKSGSTIGTGLRQLLVDMKTPTEDFKKALKDVGLTVADVDVKTKGFAGVVQTLAKAGFTAEAAYASFETRAASAFLAFKGQIGGYDELALAIARGGAAADAQAMSMDSLSAQYNRLKNDLGVVAAGIGGPLVASLKIVTSLLAMFVESITDTLSAVGRMTSAVPGLNAVLVTLLTTGIGAFFGPLGVLAGLFIGLTAAIGGSSAELDAIRTKTSDAEAAFSSATSTVNNLDGAINDLIDRQASLKGNSIALQTETVTLGERFQDLYSYLGKGAQGYDELLNAMLRYRGQALKQQGLEAQTLKTNATVELDANRQKLTDSAGLGGIFTESFTQSAAKRELTASGQGAVRAANKALTSDDIGTVTTARNFFVRSNASTNGAFKNTVQLLEERLILIKRIASLESQVTSADRQISIADAGNSTDATSRYRSLTRIHGNVNGILAGGERGNMAGFDPAIASLENAIKVMKAKRDKMKEGTGQYLVLDNDISKTEQELARLVTARRLKEENEAKVRPERAFKGTNMTGTQVKGEILKTFKGANVYSEKPRSLAKQKELWDNYKAGRGPLAAKPGTSNHGSGHAIDMTPLAGVSRDQIVSYLEGLGLEVTENLDERDPKTGRNHWHFAWKAKTSSFQKSQDTALTQLRNARSSAAVGASSSAIQALLAQAKAGTATPESLSKNLGAAYKDYTNASLAQYDQQNPATGLSGDALKVQQMGRQELVAKLKTDVEKFQADFYRAVGDNIEKTFDAINSAIDAKLQTDTYSAEAPIRDADARLNVAGSRLNKDRVGAGTSYYLQQQREVAQLNSDRASLALQNGANANRTLALGQFGMEIDALPEGEDKTAKLAKYTDAMAKLNVELQKTAALQQSVNDRVTVYTNSPLEDRLKNAAAAWADNSGVMQDWTGVMENNVGPALDMMTSTLTNVFSQIMQGSMGIKGALKSIISAIGQFVVQLIAKALALAAIKWFLKLIGVELIDTPGGVGIQRRAPGKLQGGEIKPKMMMAGGPTAGYISQGVANKDTVPILGARGEFMLRKSAVDSLGLENVTAMNRHGAKAMSRMAGATVMPAPAHQEMNLYVIKPDEKPQVGPRDMVLAITDDMLQGGVTKQLVRKISQGAM